MDFCRILSRLRSRHVHGQIHPRKISKCGLFDLLNRSLGDPSIRPHSNLSKAGLASLKRSASELGILFDRFELIADINTQKYDACSLVKQMVSLSYEMTKSGILATALRSSKLDPSIIASLPEALGKVGKYYSISCELISAARQRSKHIFQNIKVEPVSVSKPSNVGGKVHAEIQLLFFYERNLALLKPRVICSSKSACYLCNVFFEIHGIFFMPRTHGKLYSKWILPDWLETSEAQQQHLRSCLGLLKATLDNEISKASKAQTRRLSDPNESVLLPSTYWKSSSTVADQMLSPNSSTSTIRHLPSIMVNPAADGVLPPTPPLTPPDRPIGRSRVSSFSHNQMSSEAPPHVKPNELRNVKASPSSSSIRSIDVSHDQFPYSQLLTATISALYLNLEGLCLNFEFTKVVSGQLLIERFVSNGSLQPGIVTNLEDIPTTEELQMPSFDDNDTLIFHLEDPFQRQIRLTIVLTELSWTLETFSTCTLYHPKQCSLPTTTSPIFPLRTKPIIAKTPTQITPSIYRTTLTGAIAILYIHRRANPRTSIWIRFPSTVPTGSIHSTADTRACTT